MKKRIFSMALALMMMLSICAVQVSAETTASTNLVYYDLASYTKTSKTMGTGTTWTPLTSSGFSANSGGFTPRDNYSYAYVESGPTLKFQSSSTSSTYRLSQIGFNVSALADGDYTVPLRKVTMGFKTNVKQPEIYDIPVKIWFNLYAVSAEGLKTLVTKRSTMASSLLTEVNKLDNDDLVLFFWDVQTTERSLWWNSSTDEKGTWYTGTLSPIAKVGTVGQSAYVDVEYIYEPKEDGTIIVKALKVGGNETSTLIDGTTPISGLSNKEKGNSRFSAYSLRPGYTETTTKNRVVPIIVPKNTTTLDNRTELYYNKLKYEGLRELTFEASNVAKIVDDELATATITVTNHPGIALDGAIVFAVYEGDTLIGASVDENVSVDGVIGATYTNTLTIENDAFADTSKTFSYKIFLLDSMNNLVPITGEVSGDL